MKYLGVFLLTKVKKQLEILITKNKIVSLLTEIFKFENKMITTKKTEEKETTVSNRFFTEWTPTNIQPTSNTVTNLISNTKFYQ